jgi:hypothetical protein
MVNLRVKVHSSVNSQDKKLNTRISDRPSSIRTSLKIRGVSLSRDHLITVVSIQRLCKHGAKPIDNLECSQSDCFSEFDLNGS